MEVEFGWVVGLGGGGVQKLCWVVVSFVRWGRIQNFRPPLGPLFLVEVEFVGGWGGWCANPFLCQTQLGWVKLRLCWGWVGVVTITITRITKYELIYLYGLVWLCSLVCRFNGPLLSNGRSWWGWGVFHTIQMRGGLHTDTIVVVLRVASGSNSEIINILLQ